MCGSGSEDDRAIASPPFPGPGESEGESDESPSRLKAPHKNPLPPPVLLVELPALFVLFFFFFLRTFPSVPRDRLDCPPPTSTMLLPSATLLDASLREDTDEEDPPSPSPPPRNPAMTMGDEPPLPLNDRKLPAPLAIPVAERRLRRCCIEPDADAADKAEAPVRSAPETVVVALLWLLCRIKGVVTSSEPISTRASFTAARRCALTLACMAWWCNCAFDGPKMRPPDEDAGLADAEENEDEDEAAEVGSGVDEGEGDAERLFALPPLAAVPLCPTEEAP